MADTAQSLGIDIKITKSGSGAQDASADLDRMLDRIRQANDAQRKLNDSQEDGSKATEKLNVNHRELSRLLGMLGGTEGREAAHGLIGIGDAMEGSVLGPLIAITVGWRIYSAVADETKKKNEELAKSFEGFEDTQKAIRDSAQSAADFAKSLDKIKTSQKEIAGQVQREREDREIIAKLKGELQKASNSEAEAHINAEVAAGRMTPEQASVAKASLQFNAAKSEQDSNVAAAKGKLGDLEKQYDAAVDNEPRATKAVAAAEQAAGNSKLQRNAATEGLKRLETEIPKLLEATNEADEKMRELREKIDNPATMEGDRMLFRNQLADLQSQDAAGAYGRALGNKNRYLGILNAPDTSEKDLENARKNQDDNNRALSELPEKIIAAAAQLKTTQTFGSAITDTNALSIFETLMSQNRGATFGRAGSGKDVSFGQFADYLSAMSVPQNDRTQLQRDVIRQFATMMNNDVDHYSQLFQFLKKMIADRNNMALEIQDLYQWQGLGT